MMTITEKAAYIKGLIDGLDLDDDKKETKVIKALVDIIDDMAITLADLEDETTAISSCLDDMEEHIDAVDADLSDVEDIVFEEYEDFDDDFDCDFDCENCDGCDDEDEDFEYEVECPECGEVFCFDESVFDDDEPLTCPGCGYVIDEIEIEDEDED